MERQLQDNVTKRLQAILEPEDLLFDEPMKDYTTFRVGGPAKWMAAPQDEQQLRVDVYKRQGLPLLFKN